MINLKKQFFERFLPKKSPKWKWPYASAFGMMYTRRTRPSFWTSRVIKFLANLNLNIFNKFRSYNDREFLCKKRFYEKNLLTKRYKKVLVVLIVCVRILYTWLFGPKLYLKICPKILEVIMYFLYSFVCDKYIVVIRLDFIFYVEFGVGVIIFCYCVVTVCYFLP